MSKIGKDRPEVNKIKQILLKLIYFFQFLGTHFKSVISGSYLKYSAIDANSFL